MPQWDQGAWPGCCCPMYHGSEEGEKHSPMGAITGWGGASQESDRRQSDIHSCEKAPLQAALGTQPTYSTLNSAQHPYGTQGHSPPAPSTGQGQAEAHPTTECSGSPSRERLHRHTHPSCHLLMVPIKPIQTQGKCLYRSQPCREPASSSKSGLQPVPRACGRAERKRVQKVAPQPHEQRLAPSTHQEGPHEGR